MDCGTPGLPSLCYLLEFVQTHVHYLTISSSATLFSFCFNLSQHQGLFQWVGSWHRVAKVLELQLKEIILDYLSGFKCHYKWKREAEESGPGCNLINTPLAIVALKQESQEPRNVGLFRRWKTQGNGSFFRASRKECRPADKDFSPVRCVSDFRPLALLINSCSFES